MKNSECVIYIETKGTRTVVVKEGDHWIMTTTRGRPFRATAEQVLSHLLPPLAGKRGVTVTVERRT